MAPVFTIKVDVHFPSDPSAESLHLLRRINTGVDYLHQLALASAVREVHMAGELAEVQREVTETGTVMESATVLLGQLSTLIRDNATDPTALRKLATDLDAQQQALASAIVANTPAAAPPPA